MSPLSDRFRLKQVSVPVSRPSWVHARGVPPHCDTKVGGKIVYDPDPSLVPTYQRLSAIWAVWMVCDSLVSWS